MPRTDKEKERAYNATYFADPVNAKRQKGNRDRWYKENRQAHCANAKINYQFTKEQRAMQARLRLYGITQAQYDAMMLAQLGVCALCGMLPEDRWHIDHDHKTGKVRGLLCKKCNTGLGHFDDEPLLLQAAADYLNEARKAA